MRYTNVRKYIDEHYDDDFLDTVIASYPVVLRRALVKGERAIGRVIVPATMATKSADDDNDNDDDDVTI